MFTLVTKAVIEFCVGQGLPLTDPQVGELDRVLRDAHVDFFDMFAEWDGFEVRVNENIQAGPAQQGARVDIAGVCSILLHWIKSEFHLVLEVNRSGVYSPGVRWQRMIGAQPKGLVLDLVSIKYRKTYEGEQGKLIEWNAPVRVSSPSGEDTWFEFETVGGKLFERTEVYGDIAIISLESLKKICISGF